MPARKRATKTTSKKDQAANLGFEAKLWLAADKLRNNMDAAEYKHVVLGLIFLKYVSDAFEEMRAKLAAGTGDYAGADPEDADEYRAENVFWVPQEGRWPHLQGKAKQPQIGKLVDDAMLAIERDNPRLKGVLPKDFARPTLDKHRLGELIDLIGTIGLGDAENRSKDILGRVTRHVIPLVEVTGFPQVIAHPGLGRPDEARFRWCRLVGLEEEGDGLGGGRQSCGQGEKQGEEAGC